MTTASKLPLADEVRLSLTVAEAAEILGVSEWLVLKQIQQGNLPHKRFGRRIIISRTRLVAWLDDQVDAK